MGERARGHAEIPLQAFSKQMLGGGLTRIVGERIVFGKEGTGEEGRWCDQFVEL